MHNTKNITACLFTSFFIILSFPVTAQNDAYLKSIKNKIKKNNKELSEEFSAIKLIPGKTFFIQEYEGRDSLSFYLSEKTTTDSFYISPYEVTNEQYRQFIDYVQNSILRHLLGYEKQTKDGITYIDWHPKMDVEKARMSLANMDASSLKSIFSQAKDSIQTIPGMRRYTYKSGNKKIDIPVMPDIDSWKKDYPYSYNEPMYMDYFNHPAFNNYPVTGVSFYQAQAYCFWKTQQVKNALGNDTALQVTVSLPTLYQWEAAAVTGDVPDSSLNSRQSVAVNQYRRYQNKPIKTNGKNAITFDCNFFTIEDANGYVIKNAGDDGGIYVLKINSYKPNGNGLYNMKGNVAEWTTTNGDECYSKLKVFLSGNPHFTDSIKSINPGAVILNQPIDSFLKNRKATKIVKGGSWKSSAFYIQPGVNQFYNPSAQDGGIGFRYIVSIKKRTTDAK